MTWCLNQSVYCFAFLFQLFPVALCQPKFTWWKFTKQIATLVQGQNNWHISKWRAHIQVLQSDEWNEKVSLNSRNKNFVRFSNENFILCRENLFCDVTLIAENMEIPAHKMVLASCSPYFYAMFSGSDFQESRQDKVTVQGVDFRALQLLVEYVYTSYVDVNEDNVQVFSHCILAFTLGLRWLDEYWLLFVFIDTFDGRKSASIDRCPRCMLWLFTNPTRSEQLFGH